MADKKSPYDGIPKVSWHEKTAELVEEFPVKPGEILEIVLACWEQIFESRVGCLVIGRDIFPRPQVMGFFLHELIEHEFARRYPRTWRPERDAADKDVVNIEDDRFSFEVKTSSHASRIFGNRSSAQETERDKKSKSGYYLAVNFEKFDNSGRRPSIKRVRFGWLDADDWIGQESETGQQAHIDAETERAKFQLLHGKEGKSKKGARKAVIKAGRPPARARKR